MENATQETIYNRAKTFLVTTYKNPSSVIQIDDKDKGIISVKGIESYDFSDYKYKIHYTLTIAVRDGRYKYEIKDLILTGTRWSDFYKKWIGTTTL